MFLATVSFGGLLGLSGPSRFSSPEVLLAVTSCFAGSLSLHLLVEGVQCEENIEIAGKAGEPHSLR